MLSAIAHTFSQFTSRFKRDDDGVATLEFALIFPLFITLLYAVAEFSNYTMHKRRAQMAIDYAVEYISRDADNVLTNTERMNALDMWNIIHPTANGDFSGDETRRESNGFTRAFAGIEFVPTPAGCAPKDCVYEPDVNWSFYWGNQRTSGVENPIRIQCALEVVENGTTLDGTNIPRGVGGRSSAIMGVYVVQYKPLLDNRFIKQQDFRVSAIRQARGAKVPSHNRFGC